MSVIHQNIIQDKKFISTNPKKKKIVVLYLKICLVLLCQVLIFYGSNACKRIIITIITKFRKFEYNVKLSVCIYNII